MSLYSDSFYKKGKTMEYQTSIDAAVLSDALVTRIDEDAATHKNGFSVLPAEDGHATITVHRAMHPKRNLLADVTWERADAGSRVSVAYRAPREGEVPTVSFLAPILAYATVMTLICVLAWGLGFGLLCLLLGENRGAAWLLALIVPAVYLVGSSVTSATARYRARRRFEKLMQDMFCEHDNA